MALTSAIAFGDLLDYRFDAECYRPDLQAVEARVATKDTRALETVASVSDGNHISIANSFSSAGVRYLKGAELSDVFIDDSEPTYIPRSIYDQITRAHVQRGDVLLSVIGTVGPVAFVDGRFDLLSCSCKLAILRPHSISGALLAAYLLSPTGQALLLRRNRGSVQQGVVLPDVRAFPVPPFGERLTEMVEGIMKEAAREKKRADSLYPSAEQEMLERMGWEQLRDRPVELTYTTKLVDLDNEARSDAEFFQPRYARFRAKLAKSGAQLAELVSRFDKGTQPSGYSEKGDVVVVKSKQVTGRGIDLTGCERTSSDAWTDEGARLSSGDLVINSTGRGTLGRAAVVPEHREKMVAAVDLVVARLHARAINADYLALFLNSPAGLMQSDQFQTGSSGQLHLYPQHFAKFIVFLPRTKDGKTIDFAWQDSLAERVKAAQKAKESCRVKLEEAKNLVELSLR